MSFITDKGTVFKTTLFCGMVAALGHGLLWIGYSTGLNEPEGPPPIPWQPVTGITVVLVAIAAFGGFFLATEKMRVAIAAATMLSFIVLVTFVLGIDALAENAAAERAKPFVDAFVDVVKVVAGFYFGSEAVVTGAKVYASAQANGTAEQANAADSDVPGASGE